MSTTLASQVVAGVVAFSFAEVTFGHKKYEVIGFAAFSCAYFTYTSF